jgi:YidC/Oxa1 family membrane protein insertase
MTYEGALWFTDLTVPDPIMLLPLLCAGMTVVQANSKRFQDVMMQANPQAGGTMKVLMTAMGGVILVAGYYTPSALALLWATNSAFSIAQSGLLGSPVARKALGLPEAPTPAAPASGSSRGRSMLSQFFGAAAPTTEQQQQQPSKPLPAAAVGAPPPGTPIAVNYTTSKPSKRRAKF